MKIKVKDITAQLKDTSLQEETQNKEILEEYGDEPFKSERTRLESEFLSGNLSYGDRMRVGDMESGNLYDVILYPDETIGIQEIKLNVAFGKTEKYATWEEAMAAIPSKYDVLKHIEASARGFVAALFKKISEFIKNPYK